MGELMNTDITIAPFHAVRSRAPFVLLDIDEHGANPEAFCRAARALPHRAIPAPHAHYYGDEYRPIGMSFKTTEQAIRLVAAEVVNELGSELHSVMVGDVCRLLREHGFVHSAQAYADRVAAERAHYGSNHGATWGHVSRRMLIWNMHNMGAIAYVDYTYYDRISPVEFGRHGEYISPSPVETVPVPVRCRSRFVPQTITEFAHRMSAEYGEPRTRLVLLGALE